MMRPSARLAVTSLVALVLGCEGLAAGPSGARCSQEQLDTVVRKVGGEPRLEAARVAAGGIAAACHDALPPTLQRPLSDLPERLDPSNQSPRAGRFVLDAPTSLEPEWSTLLRRVCPDHATVLHEVADLDANERPAARYARCGLDRYDLVDVSDLLDAPDSGLHVWAVHQFLLDQGMAPSEAAKITRPLFDLWRYAAMLYVPPPAIELPLADEGNGRALRLDDLLVEIEGEQAQIRVGEAEIWRAQPVELRPSMSLGESLLEELRRLGYAHPTAGEYDGPIAVIVSDGELAYPVLVDVVRNLVNTNVRWVGVLTRTSAFEHEVIDIGPMRPGERPWGKTLYVNVDERGIEVSEYQGGQPTRQFARGTNGDLPYDDLAQFSRTVAAREPIAYLRGSPTTSLQEIVRAIAAIRGPGCRDGGQDGCRFARITLLPPGPSASP